MVSLEDIQALTKALGECQNERDLWHRAYTSAAEDNKELRDEVRKLTDELDEVKHSASFAGGDTDE